MAGRLKYEDVEQYLRTFQAGEPPFDFGALLQLVLTGVENLRKSAAEGDILENVHLITDSQAAFLKQLLDGRAESIEWFKDQISHSSQTGLL
ncbi:MAG: hypothetical protein GXX84_11925 [Acidobacteria bacterium]|nr:hypothetical protein [Acidobacteriota bacterium]